MQRLRPRLRFLLAIAAIAGLPACQSSSAFSPLPPRPMSVSHESRAYPLIPCPLITNGCQPAPPRDISVRSSDGNTGDGIWDGVSSDPIDTTANAPDHQQLASGSWYYNVAQTTATMNGSVQTASGPASTSVIVPNPFPLGTRVAVSPQVTMEETAPGAFTAWWSHNGVQYTGSFTRNADSSVAVAISGANGDHYATTVYPTSGMWPGRQAHSCQDYKIMGATMGMYAGFCALVGFEPAAALATIAAGGFEIAAAFAC